MVSSIDENNNFVLSFNYADNPTNNEVLSSTFVQAISSNINEVIENKNALLDAKLSAINVRSKQELEEKYIDAYENIYRRQPLYGAQRSGKVRAMP